MDQRNPITGKVIDFEEERRKEREMNNIITPAFGGKEPPTPGDWLSSLELGTIFAVAEKGSPNFLAPVFIILEKTSKLVKLGSGSIDRPEFVVPSRFCTKFMLVEELGVYKDDQTKSLEETDTKYKETEEEKGEKGDDKPTA